MLSQPKNRVQAIKSKFENLTNDSDTVTTRKRCFEKHLFKHENVNESDSFHDKNANSGDKKAVNKENVLKNDNLLLFNTEKTIIETENDHQNLTKPPAPNVSYLHNKAEANSNNHDSRKVLSRQSSDPGKKLQRSHAFRCDRREIPSLSPKRYGSCKGRPETSNFANKKESKKTSEEKLVSLSSLLDSNIGENNDNSLTPSSSVPDSEVPQHILDQYAKVLKPKKPTDTSFDSKKDLQIDSGVSSETENIDEEKSNLKKQESPTEVIPKIIVNRSLNLIADTLGASTETLKLERKNPHLILTDTLKKALKQPLPAGPPPRKPPRSFGSPILESPEKRKKDTKHMIEKLEQVLQKREATKEKNIYDIAETDLSQPSTLEKPKEIHYLCTEILDITQRTLLPNQTANDTLINCFNSLNCAINTRSTVSLPYSRLSTGSITNRNSTQSLNICCSCSSESLDLDKKARLSTFFPEKKCIRCQNNEIKDSFRCHLNCKCKEDKKSNFFIDKHIYDVPFGGKIDNQVTDSDVPSDVKLRGILRNSDSKYGVISVAPLDRIFSKSLEDLNGNLEEKIYDIPCDISRPETPNNKTTKAETKIEFQKLRSSFENRSVTYPKSVNHKLKQSRSEEKPKTKPKPILSKIQSDSKIQILTDSNSNATDLQMATGRFEKRFAADVRKCGHDSRRFSNVGKAERRDQLDLDKENLNRLMNEIYETVSAACKMDEPKTSRFPTDTSSTGSEESVKLTRSLTEKRKNYVRRVSSRVAYLDSKTAKKRFRNQTSVCSYSSDIIDNPYSTFRSWKSFKNSQNNLEVSKTEMIDRLTDTSIGAEDAEDSIVFADSTDCSEGRLSVESGDDKTGCLNLNLPFVPRRNGLLDVCLLVGLNYMTGQAYVKSVFPDQVKVPPHIENLVFPETLSVNVNVDSQTSQPIQYELSSDKTHYYSFVLTDEKGHRNYGYCRRVLPEGATSCLPLCYCIIARYRAPGFYYKVLKEIESHHGSSEVEINTILNQLFNSDFPTAGEEIILKYETKIHQELTKNTLRKSINLGEVLKSKTLPNRRSDESKIDTFHQNDAKLNNTESNSHCKSSCKMIYSDVLSGLDERLRETSFYDDNINRSDVASKQSHDASKQSHDASKQSHDALNQSHDASKRSHDASNQSHDASKQSHGASKQSHGASKFRDISSLIPEFYDLENNNRPKSIILSLETEKVHVIKRSIEPRIDESSLSVMLDSFGAGLLIKIFGSLLLERKVVLICDNLCRLSACMEGLQSILYPFVWQQPLISTIPAELRREILEAPLPMLAGLLKADGEVWPDDSLLFEEGMLIDISTRRPTTLYYQGDESTILPTNSYKTLKTTLAMETSKNATLTQNGIKNGLNKDLLKNDPTDQPAKSKTQASVDSTRNVMISEAFLRFYVDILGGFWRYFSVGGVLKEGGFGKGDVIFNKDAFIKAASSKQNQYFLEWFSESAMFNHFVQNMAVCYKGRQSSGDQSVDYSEMEGIVDAPLPQYYQLFEERLSGKKDNNQKSSDGNSKTTYKMAMNKKVKLLKNKLRDLVT